MSKPPEPAALDADEVAFWAAAAEHDGVLVSDGRVWFSAKRRAELTSLFGFAGIDIRRIKTPDDYRRARHAAAPYFADWLVWKASRGEPSAERASLVRTLQGLLT